METERARVMFLYWGRRGALTPFTLEVGRTALQNPKISAAISVSRQNERFQDYREFGSALFPIDTFSGHLGALTQAWRIPMLRRRLAARLRRDRTQVVIELMPHVWSPMVAGAIQEAGARYATIVHDADAHPGDRTGVVKNFSDRVLPLADRVFTLSAAVAKQLAASGAVPAAKIVTLFHPDLHFLLPGDRKPFSASKPMRLMFFGRILDYKGLPLFLDAVELVRQAGHPVEIGVFGEGQLGRSEARLRAMNAEIVNHWLSAAEIASAFTRYDAMVASHVEASQSGTIAAALGAGLPVIATPVGGLVEQIEDGVTGVLAAKARAPELATAIERLMLNENLYKAVCINIANGRERRSMSRFVSECVTYGLQT